nr:hypothetical protein [uncultured Acetobacteroides sp.]
MLNVGITPKSPKGYFAAAQPSWKISDSFSASGYGTCCAVVPFSGSGVNTAKLYGST